MFFNRIFIIGLVYLIFIMPVEAFNENNLDDIEYSKYGQSFSNESLSERLNRIETDFFGMEQSGDLDSRLNNIQMLSSDKIQNPSVAFSQSEYPGEKKGIFRNFLDNVSSSFSDTGTFTGYTPSMLYNSGYSNNLYRNSLRDFANGYSNYCPYHNTYHNTFRPNGSRILKRRYHGNSLSNNFRKFNHNPLNRPLRHQRLNSPYQGTMYSPYSMPVGNFSSGFASGSSVHILRD